VKFESRVHTHIQRMRNFSNPLVTINGGGTEADWRLTEYTSDPDATALGCNMDSLEVM
jgi:hypothetical protein